MARSARSPSYRRRVIVSVLMRQAVICNAVRTPVGRMGGVFRDLPAATFGALVVRAVVDRSAIADEAVDDAILGQGYPNGEVPSVGGVAALDAGLPATVPGMQMDRRCGSGLQAVLQAAMQVQTGVSYVVIVGGVKRMSQVEHYAPALRWGTRGEGVGLHDRLARARVTAGEIHQPVPGGMIETAKRLRADYGNSREEEDTLAVESHRRAVSAQDAGRFAAEIVPVPVCTRSGTEMVDADEHPGETVLYRNWLGRAGRAMSSICRRRSRRATALSSTTPARLVSLPTRIVRRLLVCGHWLAWCRGRWSASSRAGWGLGPVPATQAALGRAGLAMADMDLIEFNEALAAQVLALTRDWRFGSHDFARMNVNGSGISLGHPFGATGARMPATMLYEMDRLQARYGLETMCIGGGQGRAAVFERI